MVVTSDFDFVYFANLWWVLLQHWASISDSRHS